jgi:hypothetical protein
VDTLGIGLAADDQPIQGEAPLAAPQPGINAANQLLVGTGSAMFSRSSCLLRGLVAEPASVRPEPV